MGNHISGLILTDSRSTALPCLAFLMRMKVVLILCLVMAVTTAGPAHEAFKHSFCHAYVLHQPIPICVKAVPMDAKAIMKSNVDVCSQKANQNFEQCAAVVAASGPNKDDLEGMSKFLGCEENRQTFISPGAYSLRP